MKTSHHFRITVAAILVITVVAIVGLKQRSNTTTARPPVEIALTAHPAAPPLVSKAIPPSNTPQITPDSQVSTPCTEPILLRIGTVDPEFNLARGSLEVALRGAAHEWNTATERELFVVSSSDGVAVNLLFDGRQADLAEFKAAEIQLDQELASLAKERELRDRESQEIERLVVAFNQEKAQYEGWLADHQSALLRASEEGALTQDVVAAFREEEQKLATLREHLERSTQSIQQRIDENNRRALVLQQSGELIRESIAKLKERFPPRLIREAEHRRGEFVNEINVYTVSDARDLHYTLLHELGHVLGIPHAQAAGTIMSPIREIGSTVYHLTESDVKAAQVLCRGYNPA